MGEPTTSKEVSVSETNNQNEPTVSKLEPIVDSVSAATKNDNSRKTSRSSAISSGSKSPSSRSISPRSPSPRNLSSNSVSPQSASPRSHSPTCPSNNPAIQQDDGAISQALISKDDSLAACPSSSQGGEPLGENSKRGSRIYRTLTFRRKKPTEKVVTEVNGDNKKSRKYWWSFRFKKKLLQPTRSRKSTAKSQPEGRALDTQSCVCMGYRRRDEYAFRSELGHQSANAFGSSDESDSDTDIEKARLLKARQKSAKKFPALDMSKFHPDDYPVDDPDEMMIAQRARDMAEGIEVPPNFPYHSGLAAAVSSRDLTAVSTTTHEAQVISEVSGAMESHCVVTTTYPTVTPAAETGVSYSSESHFSEYGSLTPQGKYVPHTIHTQVDYIHCLVPDLRDITNCSFYWGIMDRYEAEKLLETKPEGTFLLRDSAQEEFLFSVSFRRYGRSLHARIEQWNHHFSFDSHDPGVFSSDTVCGLIEHYKDPSCCMFFEPMLTLPLNRNFPFSLQHMCRSVIGSRTSYDGINILPLPKALKEYLQYYHYKQKVRVRRFEVH